jgi:hypothetical protein
VFQKLDSSLFDWLSWRNGSPLDVFQVPCRTKQLIQARDTLRQHAIGWCSGGSTPCRPKEGQIAVMFLKDDRYFWFHFWTHEAAAIWNKEL